jgi:hypothetical protein
MLPPGLNLKFDGATLFRRVEKRMRIDVSCAGSQVVDLLIDSEKALTGHVHSSFQKAVNLLLKTSKGERLITLLTLDAHPWGLTCPDLPETSARFCPGMTFFATRGQLTFPSGELELDLRKSLRWEQPPIERKNLFDLRRNASALLKILLDTRLPTESSNFLQRYTEARVHSIADDWSNMTLPPENWMEQLLPMVGLGPGLTPLGDDFVSGYLTAAYLLASSDELRQELRKGSLRLADEETTFYSKQQILFAGQGICLRSIFLLIQSLTFPIFDETNVMTVLNIGATSGCGWMWGIYLAATQSSLK